jgi:hypothetical protein
MTLTLTLTLTLTMVARNRHHTYAKTESVLTARYSPACAHISYLQLYYTPRTIHTHTSGVRPSYHPSTPCVLRSTSSGRPPAPRSRSRSTMPRGCPSSSGPRRASPVPPMPCCRRPTAKSARCCSAWACSQGRRRRPTVGSAGTRGGGAAVSPTHMLRRRRPTWTWRREGVSARTPGMKRARNKFECHVTERSR